LSLRLPAISLGKFGFSYEPEGCSGNSAGLDPAESIRFRNEYNLGKIKFDNFIRLLAAVVMMGVAFVIHWFGEPVNLSQVLFLFFVYVSILLFATLILRKIPNLRILDFFICFLDIIGITASICLTGGLSSPFFFIYFLPLLIQSYHRDWGLILFYGFGSLVCYSFAVVRSPGFWEVSESFHFVARVILMVLVVSIAIFAVRLLKQREDQEKRRLSRMKVLNHLARVLNGLSQSIEIPVIIRNVVECINRELGPELNAWAEIFVVQEVGDLMRATMDPSNARFDTKQEVSTKACPAISQKKIIQFNNVEKEGGCPNEKFSFRSQICLPIFGNLNECFGVILVGSQSESAFQEEDREYLEFIGRSLGVTIQRLKMTDELRKAVEMDSCATAVFLSSTRNLKDTFSSILDGILLIMKVDQASLMLWDGELGKLVVREAKGPHVLAEKNLMFPAGEGVPGRVFETGKPVWTSNLETDERFSAGKIPFKSLLCLPLFSVTGEPMGVINAWSFDPFRSASPYEIDISMTFLSRAGIAIENVRQQETGVLSPADEEKKGQAA